MKNTRYLVTFIFVVIIATQPILTSLFISQKEWTNILATLGYLLILYPVFLVYKSLTDIEESKSQEVEDLNFKMKGEIDLLYNGTKNDFLFFEHEKNQPFVKVSSSVKDILEVQPDEFKQEYKKYKGEQLFDGVFERAQSFAEKGIRVPQYEVELISKSGKPIFIEVNEIPIFDENKEIERIWVAAHYLENHNLELETLNAYNNEKYDLLYNNLNDGVFLLRGDRFVDCNSKILDIFETTLEQILMYSPFSNKFSPPTQPSGKNSKESAIYKMRLAYEGEPQEFEWVHLKQNGIPFKTKISLVRFEYNKEAYLYAIVKDLSQTEFLKNEIVKKENFIDLLFEQSPIGIIKFDKDSKITTLNKSIRSILNINSDVSQYTLINLFKNEALTDAVEASKNGQIQSLTQGMYRFSSDDKFIALIKVIPTTQNDLYNGGLLLIEELSETSELKKALDVKQNSLEEIISNSNDVLYKYDLIRSQYEYVSQSVVDVFGYTSKEFKSLSEAQLKSLLHPKELVRADQIIAKMYKGESTESQSLECTIIDRSGHVKWIKDTYSFVNDESGKPKAILGYITDLTELKDNETLLAEKNKQIELLSENKKHGVALVVNNKIQLINSAVETMTGYTNEELMRWDYLFGLAPENDKKNLKESYLEMISNQDSEQTMTFWIKTKTGPFICVKNTYFFEKSNTQNYCIQTRDITQERIDLYKKEPTQELKKELETYLETF